MRLFLLFVLLSVSLNAASSTNRSTSALRNISSQPSSSSSSTPKDIPSSSAQNSATSSIDSMNLKTLMSPIVQKQTGIDQLSNDQLSALENWFSSYIQNKKNQANQVPSNAVSAVLSEGHYVKLGSGVVWNISPNAWLYTYYWQKGDPIEIGKSKDTLFPISLTNTNTGQVVNAQKASKAVTEAFSKSYSITKISSDGQFISLSDGSSWQVEPSARYMSAGWSKGDPIFVVKVKNSTGSPYELYNGSTTRSVFVRQIKAPLSTPSKKTNQSNTSSTQQPNRATSTPSNQVQATPQAQGS